MLILTIGGNFFLIAVTDMVHSRSQFDFIIENNLQLQYTVHRDLFKLN